jgi:hypothetical protein
MLGSEENSCSDAMRILSIIVLTINLRRGRMRKSGGMVNAYQAIQLALKDRDFRQQ